MLPGITSLFFFFFQAEDGIRDLTVTGVQTCALPISERGNLVEMSWDLGPTLGGWLSREDPTTLAHFAAAAAGGNAMAQAFHHTILPLASAADRRTEIRWGLREFEIRFGLRARGLWLPETAVDLATLRVAAEEGVAYTILAPWQAAG